MYNSTMVEVLDSSLMSMGGTLNTGFVTGDDMIEFSLELVRYCERLNMFGWDVDLRDVGCGLVVRASKYYDGILSEYEWDALNYDIEVGFKLVSREPEIGCEYGRLRYDRAQYELTNELVNLFKM